MLNKFKIAETNTFEKDKKQKKYKKLVKKLEDKIYTQLKRNPYYGKNIKKLKGEFEGVYRIRLGDYRIFYIIDSKKKIVFMLNISHRKSSYK